MQKAVLPWIKSMEDATQGRVKFVVYDSQTLTKGPDAWEAVKGGIADSASCIHGFWPGMTPLADVITLPLLPIKDAETATRVMWKLYETFPSFRKQFKDVKLLTLNASEPYFLITSKRPVKVLDDFKGLKLRVIGAPAANMMKLLKASPITISMTETYMALQKGIIDGMAIPWEALRSFKQYELVKYYTLAPLSAMYASEVMNLDTWNRLPADIQKQIDSECGEKGSRFLAKARFGHEIEEVTRKEIKQGTHEMIEYTPPAEEFARWAEVAGRPLWEQWVADTEAKGYPDAREILNTTLSLLKEYNK
jgi:TRAP-type transport system periplasmic protein